MSNEPRPPSVAGGLPTLSYVPSEHAEALWDQDLSPERHGWQPGSGDELWRRVLPWRCERSVAELDGKVVEVVQLTNGADPSWDWRTVSFWAATLGPRWRVHLRHAGRVDLIIERPA
jgi:hypothetical protein